MKVLSLMPEGFHSKILLDLMVRPARFEHPTFPNQHEFKPKTGGKRRLLRASVLHHP